MSFRNASLTAYLNSLSPVWVRRWAFRVLMLEKSALHRLHLNDFPLVWVSWWYFKVNFCAKALLQTPHLNFIRDGLNLKKYSYCCYALRVHLRHSNILHRRPNRSHSLHMFCFSWLVPHHCWPENQLHRCYCHLVRHQEDNHRVGAHSASKSETE